MDVTVRPLRDDEVSQADSICRLAFGTFLGVPEPLAVFGDADFVHPRHLANPSAFYCAEVDGEIVGSNYATHWGSVGFFGPLTVRPDLWDEGIGSRLMEPIMELFRTWNCSHTGLFTFPHSAKHHGLYQKFGFWPRFLTPVLDKAVDPAAASAASWTSFASAAGSEQARFTTEMREITNEIYPGLDVVPVEVEPLVRHRWGDVVLLEDGGRLVGFAVCHRGPGTEAGSGTCYVKFAAVRPGADAEEHFLRLIDGCVGLAGREGLQRISAGVNLGRHRAYRAMLGCGFRAGMMIGVAMHAQNAEGYSRPDIFVIDDWR